MAIDLDEALVARWESPTRWYAVTVERDLFGVLVLTRRWGSRRSLLSGCRQELPSSPHDAAASFARVVSQRERRGAQYIRVI